jgi:guanosine-3',5'-bis(diphosphate) 3'-pyrophosphohydrolase
VLFVGTWAVSYTDMAVEEMLLPHEVEQKLIAYAPDADVELVRRAYAVAATAHHGQARRSGEPYVNHSLATAMILADLHLDASTLAAALLHDVPEDTPMTLEDLRAEFGDEVSTLVDGVTKLERIQNLSRTRKGEKAAAQAENVRKVLIASVDDIRVIMIKLADRLHNMRTLHYLPEDKQSRIAQETLDIYAPVANRLGIWELKWQLEDLALQYLQPDAHREISGMLAEKRQERQEYIDRVIEIMQARLAEEGLEATVTGRSKHLYSIYHKMQEKNRSFGEIYDLTGVRILVQEIRDCYAVLGIIHSMWRPIPGEFDDYVAMPKSNLYQSLHTAVIGPEGQPLEMQIRTWDMHRVAEYGIASHWRYKEQSKRDQSLEARIDWLRRVSEWRQEVEDASEFVESLKSDVFPERVYVFTPKGDIFDLPQGATPVDFAYCIHTEVGQRCRGAKVNGRLVPLDYQLRTGEQVDILTAKRGGPSRDWLNPQHGYLRTARARQKVRQWFRQQERGENVAQGREILDKELHRLGLEKPFEEIAKLFKYQNTELFLAAIGYGDISPQQIAGRLDELAAPTTLPSRTVLPSPAVVGVQFKGVGDLLSRLARCCSPVPGDPIIGYITRGKGVTVHRRDCTNVRNISDTERLIDVEWGASREVYPVKVRIEAFDRAGLLRDIATVVADEGIRMSSAQASVDADTTATITATLEIGSVQQLRNVLSRLEGIRDVLEVRRERT